MYDIYEKYISEDKNANLIHSIQMGSTYNLKKAEHRFSIASCRTRYVERNLYWYCSQISLYLKTTAEEHDEGDIFYFYMRAILKFYTLSYTLAKFSFYHIISSSQFSKYCHIKISKTEKKTFH